jgi:hypothetical protein
MGVLKVDRLYLGLFAPMLKSSGGQAGGTFLFLLFAAAAVGVAYLIYWWNRSGSLSINTGASQDQIIQTCVQYCTKDSYITTTQVGQSATFIRELGGGGCVGFLLLLLLLIPGVVYFIFHKSRATLAVNIQPLTEGTNVVSLHWNHWGTVRHIVQGLEQTLAVPTL